MVRQSFAAAVLLLVAAFCRAAETHRKAPEDLAALLASIRATHSLPALGAAVVRGKELAAIGVTGVRAVGSDEKVTAVDRWHLGSCTKAMAATLVARLVEEKSLRWDLTLAGAFPELKTRLHAGYRAATLRQLLEHRAGLPVDPLDVELWERLQSHRGAPRDARRILAESLLTSAPVSPPGSKYAYSNAGYAIAGHIAERIAGKPFEELLRVKLFAPLGMKSAGFGAPGTARVVDEPRGHKLSGAKLVALNPGADADNPQAIAPAGTVHSSLADWAKFAALHLAGAREEKRPLVSLESFRELHRAPEGGDYALGWIVGKRDWAGGRVLMHAGSNTFWYCEVWLAPERDAALLVATNCAGDRATQAVQDVLGALIERFLVESSAKPAR